MSAARGLPPLPLAATHTARRTAPHNRRHIHCSRPLSAASPPPTAASRSAHHTPLTTTTTQRAGHRRQRLAPAAAAASETARVTFSRELSEQLASGVAASDHTSERVTYTRETSGEQATAACVAAGLLSFAVCADELPAVRLAILCYSLWSVGEYAMHRFMMHAPAGAFGDRLNLGLYDGKRSLNRLHIEHHIDTAKDMTMKTPYDLDAIYFHLPNSAIQAAFASTVLLAADAGLDLNIPAGWVPLASIAATALHNTLWNSLHCDMHEVDGSCIADGAPAMRVERAAGPEAWRRYVQWVYSNHTTHHDLGGGCCYNIIAPGADAVFGSYTSRSAPARMERARR